MERLQGQGWNICRQRVARIEAREACVSDFEIFLIAAALEVEFKDLFPKMEPSKQPLYAQISSLLADQVKSIMSPEDILLDRSLRYLPVEMKIDNE